MMSLWDLPMLLCCCPKTLKHYPIIRIRGVHQGTTWLHATKVPLVNHSVALDMEAMYMMGSHYLGTGTYVQTTS
jgi:hypothetical protein